MKCEDCKWWKRGQRFENGTIDKNGSCHRHAPKPARITLRQAIKEDYDGWPITRWPETAEYQYCGEFTDKNKPDESLLNQSISGLQFSDRLNNALWRNNIRTIQQLIDLGRKNTKGIKMIGSTSIREISRKLADIGIIW